MSNKDLLENIKKLREITGVGFKDCKIAIDENKGDIDKSIEYLRKKGIAKASKKMNRTASEGLVLKKEKDGEISLIEINSETDFVAKNKDFINFCKELSDLNFINKGNLDKLNSAKMKNNLKVEENLINLISKIGEKITIRRSIFFDKKGGENYSYVHSAVENNIGKIISIIKHTLYINKNKPKSQAIVKYIPGKISNINPTKIPNAYRIKKTKTLYHIPFLKPSESESPTSTFSPRAALNKNL